MSVSTGRRVTARKAHRCDSCGRSGAIRPGHVYYTSTIFPGDDASGYDVPVQFKECGICATRYGRGYVLEPMPEEQAHRVYTAEMNGWSNPYVD